MIRSLLKPAPVTLALFLVSAVPAVLFYDPDQRLTVAPALVAVMIPAMLLVLYVHELGHVVGGLRSGYRFLALIGGPIAVTRVGGRLALEWNRLWSLYGGIAMMAPRGGQLPSTRESIALFAAGPLASLLLGVLFLGLHYALDLDDVKRSTIVAGTHTIGDLLLGAATRMIGMSSVLVAAATMIPNAVGGFTSDGAAIRILLRGGPAAERLQAMNALMGQLCEGTRPRDWSPAFVERATALHDGSAIEFGAAGFGLQHALDRGDRVAATAHLLRMQRASEKAPSISRGELYLAEAWLAVADGRVAAARAAWAQSADAVVEEFSRHRVLAAILLAEGESDAGIATAKEGLRLWAEEEHPFLGAAQMEREWLDTLAEGQLPAVLTPTGVGT